MEEAWTEYRGGMPGLLLIIRNGVIHCTLKQVRVWEGDASMGAVSDINAVTDRPIGKGKGKENGQCKTAGIGLPQL